MKGILVIFVLSYAPVLGQSMPDPERFSIRSTALLFPSRILATVEAALTQRMTLQLESDFTKMHGFNLKYFPHQSFHDVYLFAGNAWISNKRLRKDEDYANITYLGIGYVIHLKSHWVIDMRGGIGPAWNAVTNSLIPVFKVGIGKTF